MFVCALTKEKSDDLVISKKTGIIFDRITIKNYLLDNDKCPLTN